MLHAKSLRSLRVCSRGKPEYGAKAVPARGFAVRSRAASGPRSSGTMTGPRGARCTGAGEGPPVRTRRFQETRPEVEPGAQSLGERRSGAPGGVAHRSQGARRASQARSLQFAPFGAPLPQLFLGELNKTRARMRRENEGAYPPSRLDLIERRGFNPPPKGSPGIYGGKARSGAYP
jgi:hypothetical protein